MPIHGPVLVAVDLTAEGDEALRQASVLAEGLQAELSVTHILPELHHARMLFPHLHRRDDADLQQIEHRVSAAVAAHVQSVTGRAHEAFRVLLDSGTSHAGVLRQAETCGAGSVVVPPGGSATQVVRHAQCPVLVARAGRGGGCILGATDLSDPAVPALEMAASESARRGLPLAVVHALDLTPPMAPAGMDMTLPMPMPSGEEKLQVQQAALAELRGALIGLGAKGEAVVAEGPAVSVVLAAARSLGAELLVIGTRGRTGLARLALGSVAEALIRDAPCSVLVVRLAGGV
jgi:nucleotide-binding universal stress UspA family protein